MAIRTMELFWILPAEILFERVHIPASFVRTGIASREVLQQFLGRFTNNFISNAKRVRICNESTYVRTRNGDALTRAEPNLYLAMIIPSPCFRHDVPLAIARGFKYTVD